MRRAGLAVFLLLVPVTAWSQSGSIASDLEIASVRRQLEREKSPLRQIAGRLNLGDLFLSRSESAPAREEYRTARGLAATMRQKTRLESDMAGYATATSYVALAEAKLGNDGAAFDALEESVRFAGDSAKTWNLYASAMTILNRPGKAGSAAHNAVGIAERTESQEPSSSSTLDTHIYRYALASALLRTDRLSEEAAGLLEKVVSSLGQEGFDEVRRVVQEDEKFEVLSTTDSDAASYLSVLNRSRLRLARLYEDRGEPGKARLVYQSVLIERSDDAGALAGLARLNPSNRDESFEDAFEANPFSIELIEQYESFLSSNSSALPPAASGEDTPGALVRLVLRQQNRNRHDEALRTLDDLTRRFPRNDVLSYLRARSYQESGRQLEADQIRKQLASSPQLASRLSKERAGSAIPAFLTDPRTKTVTGPAEKDLAALLNLLRREALDDSQRQLLDEIMFESVALPVAVSSSGDRSTFERGSIGPIPFTFMTPVTFELPVGSGEPVRLTYRILGATETEGVNGLLIEPLRIARP